MLVGIWYCTRHALVHPLRFSFQKIFLSCYLFNVNLFLTLIHPPTSSTSIATVAGAILSRYGVLILGAVIKSSIGGKAPEPEPAFPAAAPAAASGDLPSVDSPEFEKFIESADDAAIMKWVESASD